MNVNVFLCRDGQPDQLHHDGQPDQLHLEAVSETLYTKGSHTYQVILICILLILSCFGSLRATYLYCAPESIR